MRAPPRTRPRPHLSRGPLKPRRCVRRSVIGGCRRCPAAIGCLGLFVPGPRRREAAADWAAEVCAGLSGRGGGAGVPADPPGTRSEAGGQAWDPGRGEGSLSRTNMDLEAKVKKVGGVGAGLRPLHLRGAPPPGGPRRWGSGVRSPSPGTRPSAERCRAAPLTPETRERRRGWLASECGAGQVSQSDRVLRLEVFGTFLAVFPLRLCLPKRNG